MQSKAATVEQYLAELPEDRRAAIQSVRKVILENMDADIEEGMQYGMIGYAIPHRVYPAGYHCNPKQPLPVAALASQKNYMSLYLMSNYDNGVEDRWFRAQWAKTGKKLDMGKCCIRFRKVDELALDVIAESFRRVSAKKFIEYYESVIKKPNQRAKRSGGAGTPRRATQSGTSGKGRGQRTRVRK